jgi:integrase
MSHATQKEHLYAIKKLHAWAASAGINMEKRLATKNFFSPGEISRMATYLMVKQGSRTNESICKSKKITYITTSANYLAWLADQVITDRNSPATKNDIKAMKDAILSYKPKRGSSSREDQRIRDSALPDAARLKLQFIFDNPFRTEEIPTRLGIEYRNSLALDILYETGMRLGELLALTLDDFQTSSGGAPATLRIKRNHDDPFDDRLSQPVAKTLGRILGIPPKLEQRIVVYLNEWRCEVGRVGFKGSDFLLVTHLNGRRQGRGLSVKALYSCISNIKKRHAELADLHPHLLRHDWNYRFTLKAKKRGLTLSEAQREREYMMGWVYGSRSAELYNERHIQEECYKTSMIDLDLTSKRV